jgi:hypothetical protein
MNVNDARGQAAALLNVQNVYNKIGTNAMLQCYVPFRAMKSVNKTSHSNCVLDRM